MYRKLLCTLVVMSASLGLVTAEQPTATTEFTVSIKEFKEGKMVFFKMEKGKKSGDEITLPVADNCKVNKGKFSFKDKKFAIEVGDAIEGGLKNEIFTKIDEKKGLTARLTTDEKGKTITHVVTIQFGGKGGKDKDKKPTDK